MKAIPAHSVDMILCDLPYGTTACKWDSVIPLAPLWEQYSRIAKTNAAIVLTGSQPFTTALISSNLKQFRYCWVWEKCRGANFLRANIEPLKVHEDVCVFYGAQPTYNPQFTEGKPYSRRAEGRNSGEVHKFTPAIPVVNKGTRYPRSVQTMPRDRGAFHPTQKPVALMEYLIRTYTNEGETVLDNCMGSGTTGVAAAQSARKFIGIEQDAVYFATAQRRIAEVGVSYESKL
jgi:adenine specific DNA methylase Mod